MITGDFVLRSRFSNCHENKRGVSLVIEVVNQVET